MRPARNTDTHSHRATRHLTEQGERRGAATVELALILPLLFVMLFGSLEVCQRIFLRQSVVIVAYETARTASRQSSDTSSVMNMCLALLEQQGIVGGSVQVRDMTHGVNNLDTVATGDELRIRISVPWAENSFSRYVVQTQGTLQVDAVMLRE